MAGAVRLAGEASIRIGAGLVSIATHRSHATTISSRRPELMSHGVADETELQRLMAKATVIAIGPGLGQSQWAQKLFDSVLQCNLPLIIDADGLNLLARKNPGYHTNWVLTPHPGEAAMLLKQSTTTIQKERSESIINLQKKYGGTIVLKGNETLTYAGKGPISICNAGNPGMASAGMGDLLTGVIAGLIAQNLPVKDAADLGVYIHAKSGDMAALKGERGTIASDLLPYIHHLANPL